MAKRAISVSINKKHLTASEKTTRQQTENSVRLAADKLKPVRGMNRAQKRIFKTITDHLLQTGILSNLDVDTLCQAAIIIDRLHDIDTKINEDPAGLIDRNLQDIRDKIFKQYMRICEVLYLSPAARAKLGMLAASNKKDAEDPLIRVIKNA